MAKLSQIQDEITALKKAINNPNNTNVMAKASMQKVLEKLQKDAKELAEKQPVGKTFTEELRRQRPTGKSVDGSISLMAMSKQTNKFSSDLKPPKPVPQPKSEDQDKYDCDDLIAKAKERRKKAKERAKQPKKTEATKNKEKYKSFFYI